MYASLMIVEGEMLIRQMNATTAEESSAEAARMHVSYGATSSRVLEFPPDLGMPPSIRSVDERRIAAIVEQAERERLAAAELRDRRNAELMAEARARSERAAEELRAETERTQRAAAEELAERERLAAARAEADIAANAARRGVR